MVVGMDNCLVMVSVVMMMVFVVILLSVYFSWWFWKDVGFFCRLVCVRCSCRVLLLLSRCLNWCWRVFYRVCLLVGRMLIVGRIV